MTTTGRRFTNMGVVNGLSKIDYRYAFIDNNLLDFIYSLPDSYRTDNKIYSAMLQKFFPKFFKDIPWQNTGLNLDGSESNFLPKINQIRNYMTYASAIREPEILNQLYELLNYENSNYKIFINKDAVKEYLQPHIDSLKVNHIEKIFRTLTIEVYLRRVLNV